MEKPFGTLAKLEQAITACERCARLRQYCREVAVTRRRAYRDEEYWGRPVAGFGDPQARVLLVGLAPGAHGANRTGRVFTGDKSGEFLFDALYKTGFANQPTSTGRNDGLALRGAYISCAARCAPPDNKPEPEEIANCSSYLAAELALLPNIRVVVCLGKIALETWLRVTAAGPLRQYPFAHGAEFPLAPAVLASYHPSQQNTQTGRLTKEMFVAVLKRAREWAGNGVG